MFKVLVPFLSLGLWVSEGQHEGLAILNTAQLQSRVELCVFSRLQDTLCLSFLILKKVTVISHGLQEETPPMNRPAQQPARYPGKIRSPARLSHVLPKCLTLPPEMGSSFQSPSEEDKKAQGQCEQA